MVIYEPSLLIMHSICSHRQTQLHPKWHSIPYLVHYLCPDGGTLKKTEAVLLGFYACHRLWKLGLLFEQPERTGKLPFWLVLFWQEERGFDKLLLHTVLPSTLDKASVVRPAAPFSQMYIYCETIKETIIIEEASLVLCYGWFKKGHILVVYMRVTGPVFTKHLRVGMLI
jgi:hypothetical protein